MPPDKRLYPLTSYSIGIWRSPDKTEAYLLVLDQGEGTSGSKKLKTGQKRFVVLVTREAEARGSQSESALSVNWLLGWIRQQIALRLRHKNPFVDHTHEVDQGTSVLAFEFYWSNIVGMDFKWPLTEDPRLVLEAAVLSKRVFNSVEEVCLYYQAQPRASNSPDMWLTNLAAANGQQQQLGPSDSASAAGPGDKQPANKHQAAIMPCGIGQQQQEDGISRASSWASGASWQSGGRSPLGQPAAAAAAGPPAGVRETGVCAAATSLLYDQHHPAEAFQVQQHADMQVTASQEDPYMFEQVGAVAARCHPQQQHRRSCSCSSMSGVPGSLSTAPTLSAGIAGMASCTALDADTSVSAGAAVSSASSAAWEGFGECPTPALQQKLGQAENLVHVKGLRVCTSHSSLTSGGVWTETACSDAGSPVYQGPDSSPPSGATAAAAAGASDAPAVFSKCVSPSQRAPLSAPFSRQLLDVTPTGYATAPCSVPNSPKARLCGRTGSGSFSTALGVDDIQQQQEQVLLQGIQQPLQDLSKQQSSQQQQQLLLQQSRRASGGSSHRSSSKQRAQVCPLCQQPLLRPLRAYSLEQLVPRAKGAHSSSPHSKRKLSPDLGHSQHNPHRFPGNGTSCRLRVSTAAAAIQPPDQEDKGPLDCSSSAASPLTASSPVSSTTSAAGVHLIGKVQVAGDQDGVQDGPAKVVQTLNSSDTAVPQVAGTMHSAVAATSSEVDAFTCAAPAVTTPARAVTQEVSQAGGSPGAACPSKASGVEHVQPPSSSQQETVYRTRTVIMTFRDPTLPHKLQNSVRTDVHMLKLYESGLPGWAIMLPSYGLYYRPVLRRVTWLLFVLLSVVSMAMGFYDLYKNVPYFKQVMVAMFRPAAAVFEWLEGHTQIRLSILLTYMLGRTQLLVQLIKFLTQTSLRPLIGPISTALAPLISAASATAAMLAWLLQPLITAVRTLAGPISMVARLLWLLLQLVWHLLSLLLWSGPLQLLQAVAGGFMGLLQVLLLPLQVLLPTAASIRAGWSAAKGAGQVARTAVPVVKSSAAAASSSWPVLAWYPLEALELMRVSTMRIMRALQAVVKFMVTLGSAVNQHRLSLMLQMRQQLRGGLRAAADSPAGRVASAVAVKMGQEQRVQRLHQRLRQTDSLVSMGSELLGRADSVAVGTTLSIDGELSASISINGAFGVYSAKGRDNDMAAMARADEDSDDEVTSALSHAAHASPAELHRSGAGLRHRSALGLGRERYHLGAAAGSSSKLVTFAAAGPEYVDGVAACAVPPAQLPATALRKSVDAAMAGRPFALRSLEGADDGCSSNLGLEKLNFPCLAGVDCNGSAGSLLDHSRVVESLHQQQHKHAGPKASASSPATGWPRQLPAKGGEKILGVRPCGGNSKGGLTCDPAATPAVHVAVPAGVVVNLRRCNSWG